MAAALRHLRIWTLLLLLLQGCLAQAQTPLGKDQFDTAYVRDYSRIITGRLFFSTKYNKMELGSLRASDNLIFRPNNRINTGVGISYRALTLNIGLGLPFLNNDDDIRGHTSYLDAQANIYTKHWATNLFLQRFQGYYVASHASSELGWVQDTELPTRPDIREANIGVSTVHILNNDRFSYRAAFNQDAWQRHSQGSWLIGGYATYFRLRADSSLVPTRLDAFFPDGLHLKRGSFWDIGLSGGYAHTFVYKEHWFLTGSVVLGGGISVQRAEIDPVGESLRTNTNSGLGWHGQFRAGAGYNSAKRYIGLSFNQENVGYLINDRSNFYWSVGNIRLNYAQRFNAHIKFMDRGIHWFRKKVKEPVQQALPKVG